MEITEKQFEAYEVVRASGVTNMWAVGVVAELSKLDKETIFEIMRHYEELSNKYPNVRSE